MIDMNTFLNALNEAEETKEWSITDDATADWVLQKIAEEKAELERLKALAENQIADISKKIEEAEKRYENRISYLTHKLAQYFETVPHKATKTQEIYRLLSGSLVKKLGGKTMKQNDEALLKYLKDSGNAEYITVTEKPKWGEFKKSLAIEGDKVINTATGEFVEGVEVIENPDTFSIKF